MMTKYIIVEEDNFIALEATVNERMADGYFPAGGVSTFVIEEKAEMMGWTTYVQAMVKL